MVDTPAAATLGGSSSWRVAWITGASSGIGREVALQLAKQGVVVAISARSADKLDELAASHPNVTAYPLDVTDPAAVAAVVAAIEADLGVIDLAILNAGVWQPMGASDFDAGKSVNSMLVNYSGLAYGVDALLKRMIPRGRGHLALVSSIAGYRGMPKATAYGPSKAAVISLAEALQPDLARHNITLSLINPGFVDTPMTRVNKFPMPGLITVEDAGQRIVKGLLAKRYEIAFPFVLVASLKLARIMPNWLFFWYSRTFLARSGQPQSGTKSKDA
jgi:NAD(P)-dependent dehydrogenase (short-subunit alcohol dehydrogenase family)